MRYKFNLLSFYKLILSICVIWLHTNSYSHGVSRSISGISNLNQLSWMIITIVARLGVPTFLIISGHWILSKKRTDDYYIEKVKYLIFLCIIGAVISIITSYSYNLIEGNEFSSIGLVSRMIAIMSRNSVNWYLTSYIFILLIILTFKNFIYDNIEKICRINMFLVIIITITFIISPFDDPSDYLGTSTSVGLFASSTFLIGASVKYKTLKSWVNLLGLIVIIDIFYNRLGSDMSNHLESSFPFSALLAANIFIVIKKSDFKSHLPINIGRLSTIIYILHIHMAFNAQINTSSIIVNQFTITIGYVLLSLFIEFAFVRRDIKKET